MSIFPQRQRLLWLCIAALSLLAILSLGRTIARTFDPSGSYDLHPYWYFGHFIRQGQNPYQIYGAQEYYGQAVPALPIHYLDGPTVTEPPVAQPGLGLTPANAAPMQLLLSPLSWLSWRSAKAIFLICNLILVLAIPWMVLALLPPSLRFGRIEQWLIAVIFYALKAPRVVAWNGQTSLLVMALMVAALLLRKRSWLLSGLCLGIALSKYSLALPAALFLLLDRRILVLLTAAFVQGAAILWVSMLGEPNSPQEIVRNAVDTITVYVDMVRLHADAPGIHLGNLIPGSPLLGNLLVGLCTVAVVWGLGRWWQAARSTRALSGAAPGSISNLDVLPIMTILSLWSLLALYHRNYDTLFVIFFFVVGMAALHPAYCPSLSLRQSRNMLLFLGLSVGIMSLPGDIVRTFLPDSWGDAWLIWVDRVITLTMSAMLAVSLWLLLQRRPGSSPTSHDV